MFQFLESLLQEFLQVSLGVPKKHPSRKNISGTLMAFTLGPA